MSQPSSPASTVLRRYALTGGIGSGKSTIASLFVEHGAFLVDADAISRSLMEPGEAVLTRTVAEFGEHLLEVDGRLNRRCADDAGAAGASDPRGRHHRPVGCGCGGRALFRWH